MRLECAAGAVFADNNAKPAALQLEIVKRGLLELINDRYNAFDIVAVEYSQNILLIIQSSLLLIAGSCKNKVFIFIFHLDLRDLRLFLKRSDEVEYR